MISRRRSSASGILTKESSSEKADRCSAGSVHRHAVISRICSKKKSISSSGSKSRKTGETAICCLRTMDMIRKKYKDVTRDQSDGNGLTGWQYWGV